MKKARFCIWLMVLSAAYTTQMAFAKNPGGVYPQEDRQEQYSLLKKAWESDINTWIEIDKRGANADQYITDPAFYQKAVKNAYNAWFKDSARQIRQNHREQEFSDVYSRLQKGVAIKEDPSRPVDLKVQFMSPEKFKAIYGSAEAVTDIGKTNNFQPIIYLPLAPKNVETDSKQAARYQSHLTHEAGHTLGFTEQYPSLDRQNADRRLSSSQWDPKSVMNGGGSGEQTQISPADATTLINLLDAEGLSGNARKGKEWAALGANDPDKYKDGRRIGSERESSIYSDGNGRYWITSPNGTKRKYEVSKNTDPKVVNNIMNARVTFTQWENGKPVRGTDQYGHNVIIDSHQGHETRLFFDRDKLLVVDQTAQGSEGPTRIIQASSSGNIRTVIVEKDPATGKTLLANTDSDSYIACPPDQVWECGSQRLPMIQACEEAQAKDIQACINEKSKQLAAQQMQAKAQGESQNQTPQGTLRAIPPANNPRAGSGNLPANRAGMNPSNANTTRRTNTPSQPGTPAGTHSRYGSMANERNSGVIGAASTRYNGFDPSYNLADGNQIIGVAH